MKWLLVVASVAVAWGCGSNEKDVVVPSVEKLPAVSQARALAETIENGRLRSVVPEGWRGFNLAEPESTSIDRVGEKVNQLANALRESQVVSFFALPEAGFEPGTNVIWIAVNESGSLEDARRALVKDLPAKPTLNEVRENPRRLVLAYEVPADSSDGVHRQQLTFQSIVKNGANTVTVTMIGDVKDRARLIAVADEISRKTIAK